MAGDAIIVPVAAVTDSGGSRWFPWWCVCCVCACVCVDVWVVSACCCCCRTVVMGGGSSGGRLPEEWRLLVVVRWCVCVYRCCVCVTRLRMNFGVEYEFRYHN
ncbi:hypothetical protein Dimus_038504 [Dionaea muscipula]